MYNSRNHILLLFLGICALVAVFVIHGEKQLVRSSSETTTQKKTRTLEDPNCIKCIPSKESLVGHLTVDVAELNQKPWQDFDFVKMGGKHQPSDCCPEEKVAIIVPFRNRTQHLKTFVQHMHPFLARQKRYYAIYIVDQADEYPFNRATLFNVGVIEALKQDDFDCFIFHDIDTLPVNDHLIYKCSGDINEVLQFSIFQSRWNYTAKHVGYSGGVIATTRDQFMRMNGFSNCYWGWGAEDDDTKFRAVVQRFKFTKIQDETARFASLDHSRAEPSVTRMKYLKTAANRLSVDGLNSLSYRLLGVHVHQQYTMLSALLDKEDMMQVCNISDLFVHRKLYNLFHIQ